MLIGHAIRSVRPWFGGRAQTNPSDQPAVAVRLVLGRWLVDDANTHVPHGYVVTTDNGASFHIDTNGHPGLTIQITSGRPEAVYP